MRSKDEMIKELDFIDSQLAFIDSQVKHLMFLVSDVLKRLEDEEFAE